VQNRLAAGKGGKKRRTFERNLLWGKASTLARMRKGKGLQEGERRRKKIAGHGNGAERRELYSRGEGGSRVEGGGKERGSEKTERKW